MNSTRIMPLALLVVLAPPATAQGTARSMDLDVSVRSIAMGSASNALHWGDEFNHWGNPALTGYVRGICYEYGRAQLVPGLAPDVTYQTQVVKLGGRGVGVVMSGTPFPSGVEIDFGESTGPPPSFEDVESWGFGASASGLVNAVTGGSVVVTPALSRRVDLSFGMNFKDVEVALSGISDKTSAQDWGIVIRGTPVLPADPEDGSGIQLDLAYGFSILSGNDDATLFGGQRVSRHIRNGVSARLVLNPAWLGLLRETPDGWLFAGLFPLISIGATADWSEISGGTSTSTYDVSGQGLEVAIANVLAVRVGHYRDPAGQIEDATWGFAFGIPVGRLGGVRYESAWTPQSSGLDHRSHHGFSLWVDPLAAWELRSAP